MPKVETIITLTIEEIVKLVAEKYDIVTPVYSFHVDEKDKFKSVLEIIGATKAQIEDKK